MSVTKLVIGNAYILPTDAESVRILDAGDYYESTNVEGALQEVGKSLSPDDSLTLEPVISRRNTEGVQAIGNRYLIDTAPTGVWVGKANQIAEWDGSEWIYTIPITGNTVYVAGSLRTFRFNGTLWAGVSSTAILSNGQQAPPSGLVMGTNNNTPLLFKVNNVVRATIDALGALIIGASPSVLSIFKSGVRNAAFKLLQASASFVFQRSTGATIATLSAATLEATTTDFVGFTTAQFSAFANGEESANFITVAENTMQLSHSGNKNASLFIDDGGVGIFSEATISFASDEAIQLQASGGTIALSANIIAFNGVMSTAPTDPVTPAAWAKFTFQEIEYKIPLFQ